MSNWNEQSKGVLVSGNYLEHTRKGYNATNARRFGENPLTERTDFLLKNNDGTHRHLSVDAYGNIKNWGDHR